MLYISAASSSCSSSTGPINLFMLSDICTFTIIFILACLLGVAPFTCFTVRRIIGTRMLGAGLHTTHQLAGTLPFHLHQFGSGHHIIYTCARWVCVEGQQQTSSHCRRHPWFWAAGRACNESGAVTEQGERGDTAVCGRVRHSAAERATRRCIRGGLLSERVTTVFCATIFMETLTRVHSRTREHTHTHTLIRGRLGQQPLLLEKGGCSATSGG